MTLTRQQHIVLLHALLELGGSAPRRTVLAHIQNHHYWGRDDANDTIRDSRPSEKIWRNEISYARKQLFTLGHICQEQRGIWRISESGKEYFQLLVKQVINLPGAESCRFTDVFYNTICELSYFEEETEDRRFLQQLALDENFSGGKNVKFNNIPLLRGTPHITASGRQFYPRDVKVSKRALHIASHTCEIDPSHPSFIRKNTSVLYMEPHHLIPMSYSDHFDYSLDREQNIFCLCSNCHNQIHYGRKEDVRLLIQKLFSLRCQEICAVIGREITEEEIFKMYNV